MQRTPFLLFTFLAACGSEVPAAEPSWLLATERLEGEVGGVAAADGVRWVARDQAIWADEGDGWAQVQTLEFTPLDLVALPDGRLALTDVSVGYLLDLETGSLTEHFCYEPVIGERPDPPVANGPTYQRAAALAYDAESDMLVANPQTLTEIGQRPVGSEVASFDRESGTELRFTNLGEPEFFAGGMLSLGVETLVLGEGSVLSRVSLLDGEREPVVDLAPLGIDAIRGLAVDGDVLLVATADALVSVDYARVAAALRR